MRIAFDLDDTLIPSHPSLFTVERPRGVLGRLFAPELMRTGTRRLLRELRACGCELWVYTTSLRSPGHVRRLFWSYGAWLGGVVNADAHWKWLKQQSRYSCSKYPPAFGIDLLVDDSEGVVIEGKKLRFQVVHVRPDDADWADRVLAEVR
jgi:hypothetical protein